MADEGGSERQNVEAPAYIARKSGSERGRESERARESARANRRANEASDRRASERGGESGENAAQFKVVFVCDGGVTDKHFRA